MQQQGLRLSALLCLLATIVLWTIPAAPAGSLAVGLPADVAKQGVAIGYTVNADSVDIARDHALQQCRTFEHTSDLARSLCKTIDTFTNRCVAVALDPADGTPGVGWAIDADQQTAEKRAQANCEATAGASRRSYCKIMASRCDTKG